MDKRKQPRTQDVKDKISKSKIGKGKDKTYNKICKNCEKNYHTFHNRSMFCCKKCMNKYNYHNGDKGIKQKERVNKSRQERYSKIGCCELCGIDYTNIKTLKDLGSNMMNAASVFMKDHIIPKSHGGDDAPSNLRYLCWFCNMTRKDIHSKYDEAIKQASRSFWRELNKIPLYT